MTAWATVALAVVGGLAFIANVVIAGFTLKAARATRRAAEATETAAVATRDEADATRDEAAATRLMVEEVRTDRELNYRPYLSFNAGMDHPAGGLVHYQATVINVGRGPAINCLLARFMIREIWCLSANFELGSNQSLDTFAPAQVDPPPAFLGQIGAGRTVMFCQDQFGACHMFDPPRAAQVSAMAEGAPEWAAWYRERIDLH